VKSAVREEYREAAADGTHWWVRGRHKIFARVLAELVSLPASARILDVGPGHGVNVALFQDRGRLCVLDSDASSLDSCRELGVQDTVRADAQSLPLLDESVDLVSALDVIEHLDDDLGALRECRRVLKPSGWLLLSVPALRLLWGRQDVLSEHRRRYRRRELRDRLTAAGFEVHRLTYFNTLLFPPILVVRLLMRPLLGRTVRNGRSDFSFPLPLGLNGLLHRLFAAEAGWLVRHDLPIGVSLLCLARPAP
jgi:SAM-dependent methyltransferase